MATKNVHDATLWYFLKLRDESVFIRASFNRHFEWDNKIAEWKIEMKCGLSEFLQKMQCQWIDRVDSDFQCSNKLQSKMNSVQGEQKSCIHLFFDNVKWYFNALLFIHTIQWIDAVQIPWKIAFSFFFRLTMGQRRWRPSLENVKMSGNFVRMLSCELTTNFWTKNFVHRKRLIHSHFGKFVPSYTNWRITPRLTEKSTCMAQNEVVSLTLRLTNMYKKN